MPHCRATSHLITGRGVCISPSHTRFQWRHVSAVFHFHFLSFVSSPSPSLPPSFPPFTPDLLLYDYGTCPTHVVAHRHVFFASHSQSVRYGGASPQRCGCCPSLFCLRRSMRLYAHICIFVLVAQVCPEPPLRLHPRLSAALCPVLRHMPHTVAQFSWTI